MWVKRTALGFLALLAVAGATVVPSAAAPAGDQDSGPQFSLGIDGSVRAGEGFFVQGSGCPADATAIRLTIVGVVDFQWSIPSVEEEPTSFFGIFWTPHTIAPGSYDVVGRCVVDHVQGNPTTLEDALVVNREPAPTITATPGSGAAGTTIQASGINCTEDEPELVLVRLATSDDLDAGEPIGEEVESVDLEATEDGDSGLFTWSGSLMVPADTLDGTYEVWVFCFPDIRGKLVKLRAGGPQFQPPVAARTRFVVQTFVFVPQPDPTTTTTTAPTTTTTTAVPTTTTATTVLPTTTTTAQVQASAVTQAPTTAGPRVLARTGPTERSLVAPLAAGLLAIVGGSVVVYASRRPRPKGVHGRP